MGEGHRARTRPEPLHHSDATRLPRTTRRPPLSALYRRRRRGRHDDRRPGMDRRNATRASSDPHGVVDHNRRFGRRVGATAVGGAWKDAPIEGFSGWKFLRSPAIATAWAVPFS